MKAERMQEGTGVDRHAMWVVRMGVSEWKPLEFVQEALKCKHPFLSEDQAMDDVKEATIRTVGRGPKETTRWRRAILDRWERRAAELDAEEARLHSSMDQDIARVLKGKRLLLLKELLEEINHPDKKLIADMVKGFQVLGNIPRTGAFEPQEAAPPLPVSELLACARTLQALAMGTARGSGDAELDRAITDITRKEAEEGRTLLGPYSISELEKRVGPLWIPSRRFGVRQGEKVREIDDFSEYLVNLACGICEKIRLRGIDDVAAMSRSMQMSVDWENGHAKTKMADGSIRTTGIAKDWTREGLKRMRGRCADLKAAYKQCARRASDKHASIIVSWDSIDGEPRLYEAVGLMFGAKASVIGFNRCARALRNLAVQMLDLTVSNFVDDFPQVEFDQLATEACEDFERMMDLLGWKLKATGDDCKPEESFVALGCNVSFKRTMDEGFVEIANKPGRVVEIRRGIDEILKRGHMTPLEAQQLRGRFRYAGAQVMGRSGARALRVLNEVECRRNQTSVCDGRLRKAMREMLLVLEDTAPRRIVAQPFLPPPTVLFTDGACEDEGQVVSSGAVIYVPGSQPRFFCMRAEACLREKWRDHRDQKQLVLQAEMAPLIVSRWLWPNAFADRYVLQFVDNDAARWAVVKGSIKSDSGAELADLYWKTEIKLRALSWTDRVRSASNVGDAASRFEREWLVAQGYEEDLLPASWERAQAWTDASA